MAYPDFIPDGKKWNATQNCFENLDKGNLEDLHKILEQKNGEIAGLHQVIKEKDELQLDTVKKLIPPDMAKKLNEYQTEITALKALNASLSEEIEGYKREAEAYKHALEEMKAHTKKAKKE